MTFVVPCHAGYSRRRRIQCPELGISLKTLYNKLHKYEEERRMRAAG
jgi:hypothetical protein